jgi:hypothetical protein
MAAQKSVEVKLVSEIIEAHPGVKRAFHVFTPALQYRLENNASGLPVMALDSDVQLQQNEVVRPNRVPWPFQPRSAVRLATARNGWTWRGNHVHRIPTSGMVSRRAEAHGD